MHIPSNPTTYLTVQDICADLGMHRLTVSRWLRTGRIPGAMKPGRAWLVPVEAYEAFKRDAQVKITQVKAAS